jgi:beta-lactamase superfamily II metal-dependent hydrolase
MAMPIGNLKLKRMYKIHLLPAGFGDSILIEYGTRTKRYILIDGGPYFIFRDLMKAIKEIAPDMKELELLVITHVDIDHIDGIIQLLNQPKLPFPIREVWYNGRDEMKEVAADMLGVLQGEYLSVLIKEKKLKHNAAFKNKAVVINDKGPLPVVKLRGGLTFTLLGPTKTGLAKMLSKWDEEVKEIGDADTIKKRLKLDRRYDTPIDDLLGSGNIEALSKAKVDGDKSEANGSSIAFIATFKNQSCLFAGDLFTAYLKSSIERLLKEKKENKLVIDAWKLAHHGSKKSTLDELMRMIKTTHILVSSDGKRFGHPDQATIAKLIKNTGPDIQFYFNYKTTLNKMWDNKLLKKKFGYEAHYPIDPSKPGITLSLIK